MTVTLDLPPHLASRVEADARAQGRTVSDLLLDAVFDLYATDTDTEPIDEAFVAELIAADEETERIGTISFEEVVRRMEADAAEPDFLSRLRARQAAYKAVQTNWESAA